ncbi:MAG: leucine-rich repeat protein [Clostridia bacterium]|nr:leucine-rich repeat protein [Clostridia bacterium]
MVSGAKSDVTELVIPDSFYGYPVKEIAEGAFKSNTKIESLYISKNIQTINKQAFMGCTNLSNITFAQDCALDTIGA